MGERGSLPATFYVLRRVIFFMANDNSRKFKQNQLLFCIEPRIVAVSYTHLDVYKRQVYIYGGSYNHFAFSFFAVPICTKNLSLHFLVCYYMLTNQLPIVITAMPVRQTVIWNVEWWQFHWISHWPVQLVIIKIISSFRLTSVPYY